MKVLFFETLTSGNHTFELKGTLDNGISIDIKYSLEGHALIEYDKEKIMSGLITDFCTRIIKDSRKYFKLSENGTKSIDVDTIRELAKDLNIPTDALLNCITNN